MCFSAWNEPILRPNCSRIFEYSTAISIVRQRAAEAVGRDADAGEIEEPREDRPALALDADERRLRDGDVLQHELADAPREVEVPLRLHAHALGAALHQEERDAGGTACRPSCARRRGTRRRPRVLHEELRARQHVPVARLARRRLDARRIVRGRPPRDERAWRTRRRRGSAGSQAARCASVPARSSAAITSWVGGMGRARRRAQLLEHQRQVERAEPEAALLLGDDEPHPSELGHLLVELARHAVVRLGGLTHQRRRALPCQELARRALQRFLLLREAEVDHGART